jgi:hypothetical protein
MENQMTLEFQNAREDYLVFYKFIFRKRFLRGLLVRIVIGILFSAFVGIYLNKQHFDSNLLGLAIVLSFVGFTFFSIVFMFIGFLVAMLIGITLREKKLVERKKITINEFGLFFESSSNSRLYGWKDIRSAQSNHDSIYVSLPRNKFIVISKRNFYTENELDAFLKIIQSRIPLSK